MRNTSIAAWIGITACVLLVLASTVAMARQGTPETGPQAGPASEAASVSGNTGQAAANDIASQEEGAALPGKGGAAASGLTGVMAVTLIIWVGLFAYVYRLDRKVRRLEGS